MRVRTSFRNRQYFVNAGVIIIIFIAINILFYQFNSTHDMTWEECNITRYDVWKALEDNLDINKDGIIDTEECMERLNASLNDSSNNNVISSVTNYIFSVSETIVKFCAELAVLCDSDKDQRVTEVDFNNTETTCIKTCKNAVISVYTLEQLNKRNPVTYFFFVFFLGDKVSIVFLFFFLKMDQKEKYQKGNEKKDDVP